MARQFKDVADLMKAVRSGELDEEAAKNGGFVPIKIGGNDKEAKSGPQQKAEPVPESSCSVNGCSVHGVEGVFADRGEEIPYNDQFTEMPIEALLGQFVVGVGLAVAAARRGAEGLALTLLEGRISDVHDEMVVRMAVEADRAGVL